MRSLIAEDDPVQRKVLAKYLAPYGEVVLSHDGTEALDQFTDACGKGRPFDLVLLDIRMPGADGIAVLDAIRGDDDTRRAPRVVMITSIDEQAAIINSFRHQCDAYLVKPVLRFDLIRQLKDLGLLD